MESSNQRVVGIDLGKRSMEVRFLTNEGNGKAWNCKTDRIGRNKLYKLIHKDDLVGIEACSLAFVIAKEIITKTGAQVVVLNPNKLAIIYASTKKTDSEDAMKIARLLLRNPVAELPTVPLPSDKEMEDRALVKEMGFTKQERTKYINRLHAVFVSAGVTTITKKELSTQKKREQSVNILKHRHLIEASRLIRVINILEEQIIELENEQTEALRENELTHYVMSVPGVGPQTALAFLAYIGDGSRFMNEKEVGNYAGLVPKVDISGDTARYGHITKQGCTAIRRVAIQAAWALVRSTNGGALAKKYTNFRTRMGAKKAIVAIARKLIILLWVLVKNRVYYNNIDQEKYDTKMKYYKLTKKLGSVA